MSPVGDQYAGSMATTTPGRRRVITVYPITGRQLFFKVPHRFCEECNLTIRAVRTLAERRGDIEVRVRPWFNHLFDALRRGGWHAPVVTIDGEVFSQGIVPDIKALDAALGPRGQA